LIFYTPVQVFVAAMVGLAILALHEFYQIAAKGGLHPLSKAGLVAAVLWLLVPNLDRGFLASMLALALLGAATLANLPVEKILSAAAVTAVGVLYIAGPVMSSILLHSASPHWLVLVIVAVAVGDSIALVVGKLFGRHRLAPVLSPQKTWEGTVASMLASMLAGTGYAALFLGGEISLAAAAALALSMNVVSQIGDLVESALKRSANLKDSGSLLPGHGGVLDRLDGLLFAVPLTYGYLQLA
jgi:phosphatidate cytidylyltransferase